MKRVFNLLGIFSFFTAFSTVFSLNFVSAQTVPDQIGNFAQQVIDGALAFAKPFFEALLGEYSTSEFFLAKVLFLILLFIMVYTGVKSTPRLGENKTVVLVVSLIVSILGVRYLSTNQLISGILLPYGVLALTLVTFIIFFIYFYFVHKTIDSATGRKVAWLFFIVVFLAMWVSRYDTIGSVQNYIYFGTLVLAVLLILFDKSIRQYFALSAIEKATKHANEDMLIEAHHKYLRALEAAQGGYEPAQKQAERYRKFLLEHGVKNI